MYRQLISAAALWAAATASLVAPLPAQAQTPAAVAAASAPSSSASSTAAQAPACVVDREQARFDYPLPRTARLIADGAPVKIVALGSSSTYGAGASTSAAAYPSRLADELAKHFPGHEFTVLNRGVNGEEITDMLERLDSAVIAEHPDLVLWQVGTNSVLREKALEPHVALLHEGMLRLKATGADVVLIDPQYAPRVIAHPDVDGMVALIANAAKADHIGVFHRFDLMHHWYESEHLPFETFVSPDGLHMNDWSYACLAKWLGVAIAETAARPTATAVAPSLGR
jgi:acyl-CoA thioesterase I